MTEKLKPQDIKESHNLLEQLFKEVSEEEGLLAAGTKLGKGAEALKSLRESRIIFGNPKDNLFKIGEELFNNMKIELSEICKKQMREQYDFYYMTLAVSMQPSRGVQFRTIECSLEFGPKGDTEPIVQTIFPLSIWKDVLSWGGAMNLALNGNLEWSASIPNFDNALLEKLPSQIKGNIASKNDTKAFIAVPEYSFKLGRNEIAAYGEGNSECFWRIEKPELQETQTVKFVVVFKVPKGTTSIELTALAAAEPSFAWLTTDIRNVFENLSERLKNLLCLREDERKGEEKLPIGDHENWIIMLPK